MLPSRSLLPTNHFGTDCSACCRRGPYFPPTTSEPTAQHVALAGPYFPPTTSEPTAAVAVPTYHQPLRNRLLSMLPSRSLLPTNHLGTDCSAYCRRDPYFPPTTSEPTAQHVAVAVPTSHQPLRNRLHSMLPSRSLLPTNHFVTDCSACCRRGPYFPPTTSEPTAQHVAAAVHTSHQPLLNRLLSMLPSRSLLPTNHFGTNCCCSGPYLPPTTTEATAQHVAVAVPTSHQPPRNRLLSMLPSRSLLLTNHFGTDRSACCPTTSSRSLFLTNHFGTDCSACCRRGPYFPPTTSEPTAQHVAVAVPTPHQPLRIEHVAVAVPTSHQPLRLLSMLPSRSLLPTNHRNRLLSMLLSRSLLLTNHFGTDCSACCRRGPYSHQPRRIDCSARPYSPPTTSSRSLTQPLRNRLLSMFQRSLLPPTTVAVAVPTFSPTVAVPISHQPLRNRLLSMLLSRSLLPTNHFGTDCSACCRRGPYFPPTNHFVAVPISHQPLRNHFGTDCSACFRRGPYCSACPLRKHSTACCRRGPYSHQPLRRGPYFSPTTSEPTAQHVAAVPTSHQPLRRLQHVAVAVPIPPTTSSRSLFLTNHFGIGCSACCCRGPYFPPTTSEPTFPPTTSEPTAQHVAVAVPTSHQPLRNRLLSMLPSRSLLPPTTSTDCSARCPRTNHFDGPISHNHTEPTCMFPSRSLLAQHVAVAVPTPTKHFVAVPISHQPLRNRLLSMLPSRSLLPTNQTDCSACCRRGPYSSHQPLRNRLLSMLPSRSLLPTNHFVAVPISHQPLRNRLLSMFPSRSLLPTNHFGTDRSACCLRGPYFPPAT